MELYRITHHYDRGDQSVGVLSDIDPTPMAVYCQFMAEDWVDDCISLSNEVVAIALTRFYGCRLATKTVGGKELDMYFARESSCGEIYKDMMESGLFEREGLKEFIVQNHDQGVALIDAEKKLLVEQLTQ
ncbi:hypothetical protein [Alteromonas antoniana]|uniref:hypothetical protein n=1 Tax=Alteromonas antoniana TaxID=2803813 RepID=UPI001C45C86F|nr:hypothetical protein [Alteromonas antoniana]